MSAFFPAASVGWLMAVSDRRPKPDTHYPFERPVQTGAVFDCPYWRLVRTGRSYGPSRSQNSQQCLFFVNINYVTQNANKTKKESGIGPIGDDCHLPAEDYALVGREAGYSAEPRLASRTPLSESCKWKTHWNTRPCLERT